MKVVVQKVSQASVIVDSKVISSIKHGYMLLVGITVDDTIEDVAKSSKKVTTIRLFEDESGIPWKRNISEANGEILSVSQFTLCARTKKGTKPDFHLAQRGHLAQELYNGFLQNLKDVIGADKVQDGQFGAMMSCSLTNEGPITIILDTNE